jgi:hypothetical protein
MPNQKAQKTKAAKKLQSLQAALRYLDECGKLTIEKLQHLATLRGMEIDEETLEELRKVVENEDTGRGDYENEADLRTEIREGVIKGIQVTDAEAKGIPETTIHEYRSFFHQDQLRPRRSRKVPVLLYKYFPAERLTDVVGNRTIRFSQPSAVNDPFDVLPAILFACDSATRAKLRASLAADANEALEMVKMLDEDPEELEDLFLSDLDDEVEGHITMLNLQLKQDEERLRSSFDSQIGMLCLTERNDSILMWSHYAGNHSGFAVGFWMYCNFFSSNALAPNERPQPISYATNRPIFTPDGPPPSDPMFVKSAEWAYETEWRVIRRLDAADKVVPSSPFPIHLFTIPQEAFHSIIFGCRAPSTLRDTCSDLLLKDRKMNHVQLLETFPSQDRFLLEVRERGWKDNVEVFGL